MTLYFPKKIQISYANKAIVSDLNELDMLIMEKGKGNH